MVRTGRRLPNGTGAGVALAFGTALISGVSIWVNAMGVKQVPDAAVYTTAKNLVAGAILVAALVAAGAAGFAGSPRRVRGLDRRSVAGLGIIAVVGGSVPFVLFFTGLAQASAPSAAFIHKTLFVWVALLAVPFLGERLGFLQIGALGVLLAGQALVLTPAGVEWGTGETLIALATLLWACETIVAKRVLRSVPSGLVGAARLGVGLVVLAGYVLATGKGPVVAALGVEQLGWVALTGLLLSGYVATWFAALQRAPASVVTAILVLGAPVTAVLQVVQTGGLPPVQAVAGQALIVAAAVALALPLVRYRQPRHATVPAVAG